MIGAPVLNGHGSAAVVPVGGAPRGVGDAPAGGRFPSAVGSYTCASCRSSVAPEGCRGDGVESGSVYTVNGLEAVAACSDRGVPNAACHCAVVPLTRPNSRVGSAANCRPRPCTDVAMVVICASVAPKRLAAALSELKWRESGDPRVAPPAAAALGGGGGGGEDTEKGKSPAGG